MKFYYLYFSLLLTLANADNEFPIVFLASDFNTLDFEIGNDRIGQNYWGVFFKGISQHVPVFYEVYLDKKYNIHQKACVMFSQIFGHDTIFFGKEGEEGYKYTEENLKRGPNDFDVKAPLDEWLRKYEYLAGPTIVKEGVFWKDHPHKIHIIARGEGAMVARWFQ